MDRLNGAAVAYAEEREILLSIAAKVGHSRMCGNRDEFVRALQAMDFSEEDAGRFWDNIDVLSCVSEHGATADISQLRNNTDLAKRLGILLDSKVLPRNLLLYRLIERHFPDFFQVEVSGCVHMGGKASRGNPSERRLVHFKKQPVRDGRCNGHGRRVELMPAYQIYQGVQPSQFSERVIRAAGPLLEVFGYEEGMRWADLLIGCKMLVPPRRMSAMLAQVISAGRAGKPITLVGAFCPDYAYEETGDPQIPFRYTFDGVGEGVGLVAQQFARIVPHISAFLSELGIEHRVVLGIGDFEADSQAILDQVKLDRPEFVRRCQSSLDAFRRAVPENLPLELELFGQQRSRGRLVPYAQQAVAAMSNGHFGSMGILHENLQEILERIPGQYRSFYERWYGYAMDDLEVSRIVYSQGGEYAALARIYQEDFGDNIIILAGDRPEMHRFNAFYCLSPTLCAKRAY